MTQSKSKSTDEKDQNTDKSNIDTSQCAPCKNSCGASKYLFFALFFILVGAAGQWFIANYQIKKVNTDSVKRESTEKEKSSTKSDNSDSDDSSMDYEDAGGDEPVEEPIGEDEEIVEVDELSDLEAIRLAAANKHSKDVADTTVYINENDGTHASGGVKFAGEIAGGWLLAAKEDGEWIIVQDGNGTISCETIEPYDFPISMAPECVNSDGDLIIR